MTIDKLLKWLELQRDGYTNATTAKEAFIKVIEYVNKNCLVEADNG